MTLPMQTSLSVPECCHLVVRIQPAIDINMVTQMHIYSLLGRGQYRLEILHITLEQTGAARGVSEVESRAGFSL